MDLRLNLVSDQRASTVLMTMPATDVIVIKMPKVQFDIPTSMVPNIE
jgi:hypothetical protein